MTAPAEIAPADPADHEALADFLAAFPGLECRREFWQSRLRLWWQDNPAFPGSPAGWLLRQDGAIKGFLGNLPSLFQLNGHPQTVYSITSWMILPEFRELSLPLLMEHMKAAEQTLLFDTTPTADVATILESLGFSPLPWAGDRESFIVVDCKRVLNAAAPGPLRGAGLPSLAAAGLAPLQALRLRPLHACGLLQASKSSDLGEEFDELWGRTKGLYANTNVRTAQALRWHVLEDREIGKELFVCRREGRLAGYMVLKSRTRRGLMTLDCADFWEDPSAAGVLESLLAAVWDYAQDRGLDLLTFPHFTVRLGERLGRAGLFERSSGRRALFYGTPGLLGSITPENSYFVGLQGDYGTAVS
jgi:hypothetical protein